MFSASLLSAVLLATAVVAGPTGLAGRLARRANSRNSNPISRIEPSADVLTGDKDVEYSSNWAGAVYAESEGTYNSVTGTFTVPTPSAPSGERSGTYAASAWVGIDGDTCDTAILQTGVDFTVDGDSTSYDAWYEWYPDYAYDFSGISISAGDSIKVTVTASSTTEGTAVVENLTTGQTVSKTISSSYALCEENAEWIVEDFEEGDSLVAFADFGTVTFTDAEATTKSGTTVGPSGATLIDIEQNNKVLTSASVTSSEVTVEYV